MNEAPEKPRSEWRSPQVMAPIIAAICTVLVAVIGLMSNQMRATQAPVATVIVTVPVTQPTGGSENTSSSTLESTMASELPITASVTPAIPDSTSPNITLFYDDDSFTVWNNSDGDVSIENVAFRSGDSIWDMSVLGNLADNIPAKQCIRLRDIAAGEKDPPDSCPEEFYGFFKVGPGEVYWRDVVQFEVVQDKTVIAACQMAAGTCAFHVEQ